MPDLVEEEPTIPSSEPAAPDETRARRRLWHAFSKPGRGQILVAVLLAALGFGAVTQVRLTDDDDTYAGYREQDFIDVLNGLSGASQLAEEERERLEGTLDDLRSANSRREAALGEARNDLDTYNVLAGLVPVSGPGLRITITETDGRVGIDTMVDLIQELRNAGAEAIGVNDSQRVIAQTAVEPTVAGFTFGGAEVTSPFVIDAIGDPATLREGVTFFRGPVGAMEESGATVTFREFSNLDIREVRQPIKPEYAEPDDS